MAFEIHWHPQPGVLDGLVVISVLYGVLVGPLRKYLAPEEPFPKAAALWFSLGVFTLFLAVGTPLDEIGERYLFSAHMLQHVILVYVVPIFFLLGTRDWMLRPLVSMEWSAPLFGFFTRPLVALLVFNLLFYVWHIPGLYDWALRDETVHFLEHASFIGAAFLMWWPLLSPMEDFPRLHYGPQLLFILASGIIQTPLFAFLTFSESVFYVSYLTAPRITSLSPLQDQVLGGVIMKLAAMAWMFLALAVVFACWYRKERGSFSFRP